MGEPDLLVERPAAASHRLAPTPLVEGGLGLAPPEPARPGLTPQGLLSLQRLAGNRATAALIGGAGPRQMGGARTVGPRSPGAGVVPGRARVEHHGRTTTATRPTGPASAAAVQRWDVPDIDLPDIDIPDLGDICAQIPGYDLITLVVGFDPATGRAVEVTPSSLVRAVMGLVPGGRFVHDRLVELEVLQDVYDLIVAQLEADQLTAERLERDVDEAWDRVDLTPRLGIIDEAVALVAGYVEALLADVERAAGALVDRVLEAIHTAAVVQAERLLAESETARRIWDLARAVMRYDPLRGEEVDASTEEIIEKFLLLIGRDAELERMKAEGTLATTAEWLDTQLGQFMGLVGEFGALVSDALDALSLDKLPDLPANLAELARRGVALIQRVADFATTVAAQVLAFIKDALLGLLAEHAHGVPGFDLVCVLLGRNPITDEVVPRTAQNLIKGFFTLIPGGEAQYEQLAETGVIPAAAARIDAAIETLGITWEFVVGLFSDLWASFSIEDLVDLVGAFQRITDRFAEPIGRLVAFVQTVVQEVFTLVLKLMGFPSDLLERIIANALAAFDRVQADPIRFFENLLAALKLGLGNFFSHIVGHLVDGLADWLLRGLAEAGIEVPEELTLESVLDLVLQVLGITVENLWSKLAERIGPERVEQIRGAVDRLTGIWTFVRDVQERGIVAIWEYLADKIGGLWDVVLQKAQDWIVVELVEAVVGKLLSMLDPTGIMAVVNSFIAFFRAVQSAIEYLHDILRIVDRYVATIADIAAGTTEPAAVQLEEGLAASIPVAIGFMANQAGLGDVAEKVREIIGSIREVVDQALDWLLDRAVEAGSAVLGAFGLGGAEEPAGAGPEGPGPAPAPEADGAPRLLRTFSAAGRSHELYVDAQGHVVVASGTPKELGGEHHQDALQQAQDTGEADQAPTIAEMATRRAAFERQLAELRTSESQGLDPDDPRNRSVLQALDDLTRVVRQVWSAIHYTGDYEPEAGDRPGLGAVNPHSVNQGLQDNGDRPVAEHLLSEHVIPRSWLSGVFSEAFGARPISQSQYDRMVTVNIYRGAAADKTNREGRGDNTRLREVFTWLVEQGQDPSGFVVERVDLTAQAVAADHRTHQRPGTPLPDRAAIASAAGQQMRQAVAFLRENAPAVGRVGPGAPEGLERARELSSRAVLSAEELSESTTLLSNLTRWLNQDGAGAEPNLRRRVRTYQEKLRAANARSRTDGEEATGYTDQDRQRAVALFQAKRAAGATPYGAATQTAAELDPSPATGRRPSVSTIRRWAGE